MIWALTGLVLIIVSAGLTYMIVNLIREDEELGFRDYAETYIVILMVTAFLVYTFGG